MICLSDSNKSANNNLQLEQYRMLYCLTVLYYIKTHNEHFACMLIIWRDKPLGLRRHSHYINLHSICYDRLKGNRQLHYTTEVGKLTIFLTVCCQIGLVQSGREGKFRRLNVKERY